MNYLALSKTPLFKEVEQRDLEAIVQTMSPYQKFFAKNELLAEQDEICNRLIILQKGSVRAEMTDVSGKTVKIEDITAPQPLAILFLFGANNRFPVRATANEDCTAWVLPRGVVLKLLQHNEHLLRNFLDISANFASTLSRKLYVMSFRSLRQKICMHLLDLMQKSGTPTIVLEQTKSSLSEYFGVSRPSLERELSNMQTEGLIAINKKEIKLLQPQQMTRLVRFGKA